MGNKAADLQVPCGTCPELSAPSNMIEAFSPNGSMLVCLRCWNGRGSKPAAPVREVPRPVDPRSAFSCSRHKTIADAQERARKVAAYLGVIPEILPLDQNAATNGFTVVPDSPLVPGNRADAKNPFA